MSDHPAPARAARHGTKSAARLFAVQALYQMEQSGQGSDAVRREFLEHRFGAEIAEGVEMAEGDAALFSLILDEAVTWQAKIDQTVHRALVAKWPIARIDPVLRALFRAGGAELGQKSTPPRVVIMEYVEVAKAFYPEGREAKFVNAVLDHMAREARPEAF